MEFKITNPPFQREKRILAFIMKTFLLLFCTTVFSFSSEKMVSQTAKVFIDADKTVTVDEVFKIVNQQTGYSFIYKSGLFKDLPPIRLKKGEIKVNKLLEQLIANKDFNFIVSVDNTIIIQKKTLMSYFDEIKVSGKVTDKLGMPIPGVTILLKGSYNGISSDIDGSYSITVPSSSSVLVFSYLGFKSKEILIGDQKTLNVTLEEDISKLDEVVVTTGYQEISKERATGSFQNIEEKVLDKKVYQNILSKIEGEVSGVVFDKVDGPTIRGVSTINANNDPLIVVDGFPVTQDLSSINPNDIEKISILKDAAAASIWGLRAANGVIVIVTKKGNKSTVPDISFSSNFGITAKYDLNQLKYAPTGSYIEFEKHKADNQWSSLPGGFNQPPLGKAFETYLYLNNGLINQSEADNTINNLKSIDNRGEFSDLFMSNSIWRQQNMSISGGGERSTYRASLTYNANEGQNFFKNNDRDEIIANINNIIQISPKLSFNSNINFNTITTKNNGLDINDYQGIEQYQQILDAQGNYVAQPQTLTQAFKELKVAEGYPYNWNYNLKQEYEEKNNKNNQTLLRFQTGLKYDITSYLSLEGRYQYEWGQSNTVDLFNENTYYVRNLVNTYTVFNTAQGSLVSAVPKGEVISKEFAQNRTHSARFQVNFDKSFNEDLHNVDVIGGYEIRQVKADFNTISKFGYDPQTLTFANIGYGQRYDVTPSGTRNLIDPTVFRESEDRFISYYGNGAYTYNKKYTVSGSVRLDDGNLFGGDRKYRNIPLYSVGTKWDIYKESFLKDVSFLNQLSLRATYGSNGNIENGTSPFLQATIDRDYLTNTPYAYISDVKNPSLRLEKTYVTNLGLDFGFFQNRFSGSIEYYRRKSEDLLAPVSVNSTLGFDRALINAGEMENKGFDIQLNGEIVKTAAFSYTTRVNFSYNKNEVTNVDVPNQTTSTYLIYREPLKGKPLRYLYSYNYAGLDSKGDPLTYNENGNLVNVDGNNKDGSSSLINNIEALRYNGTTTPKYYGSWINNFSYKNLSLRVLTTYKLGYVFKNTNVLDYTSINDRHINSDFDKRWQNPGDENITNIPRIPTKANDVFKVGYDYYAKGNQFIDDASHIRLKEIILGYQIDKKALSRTGFAQLGFSFQVSNLGQINFNKWNIDPESLFLPTKPTYTFNITATL